MREINFKKKDVENLTLYNTGGFEGRLYIYSQDLVLKIFEEYLRPILDFEKKKYKLIRLKEKNIPDHILIKPHALINVDGKFAGYTMPKIEDSIAIDSINDLRKLIKAYRILFENLDYMHKHNVTVNDIKPQNILYDKNQTPIFIDVDSMGVDELSADHQNIRTNLTKKIKNIDAKEKYNDVESLDKIKLLACFVQSLEERKSDMKYSENVNNKPLVNKLFQSDLSLEFKTYISKALHTDKRLGFLLQDINEMFLREEMQEHKRRR